MKHAAKSTKTMPLILTVSCLVSVLIIVFIIIFYPKNGVNDKTPVTNSAEITEIASYTEYIQPESNAVTESSVITDAPSVGGYVPPAVRDTDFSGCLFIGDSRTEGFMLYSGVRGAVAYTARGLMVDTYFTSPVVDINGSKVSVSRAVESDTSFRRVYIMLGINELGWAYDSVFINKYENLVEHIKGCMPDAEIIVQSIIPVTLAKSMSDAVYTNENIAKYNGLIRKMCDDLGVTFIDLVPYFTGSDGALPEEAAFDGIHLQKSYCERWLDVLKMS